MGSAVNFAPPAPGTLRAAAGLLVVVLAVGIAATAVGGPTAGLVVGLASGASMGMGSLMSMRAAALACVPLGAAAALGVVAQGIPWAAGAAVAATVLLTVPANAYSGGMLTLAPIITLVFAVKDRGFTWWEAGVWGVIGGLAGLALLAVMRVTRKDPSGLAWSGSWRHGVVLALGAGVSLAISEWAGLHYGYWITVSMLVVLRADPVSRTTQLGPRLAGTLGGAGLAAITILVLPSGMRLMAAFVFLVALAAYAMSGNYFMQTLAMTPMLLIFVSSGEDSGAAIAVTVERVIYTAVGVALVVVMAWALARWDERVEGASSAQG